MNRGRVGDPKPASDTHDGELLLISSSVGLGVLAVHLIGAITGSGTLWGAHGYAFLPPWALGVGLVAVALGAWGLLASPAAPDLPRRWSSGRAGLGLLAATALGAGLVFWSFRARHLLLGDGYALAEALPRPARFHPYEPLAAAIHDLVHAALAPFLGAGREPWLAAWDAAAGVSVAAGVLFVPLAFGIARELVRGSRGAGDGDGRGLAVLAVAVLLAQGYVQLFFGYVEVYALAALGVAAYLYAALLRLDRRVPLFVAGAALALAIGLHLSAALLVPSWLVLVARDLRDRGERPRATRDLALTGGLFLALFLALGRLGDGYDLVRTLGETGWAAITRRHEVIPGYFFSWMHLRDFLNAQLLIGPLAGALLVPLSVLALTRNLHARAPVLFWIAAGGGYLAVYALAGDSNLGYARNWDLFAPAGVAMTAGGLGLLFLLARNDATRRRLLQGALAISLFHTGAWVALNASAEASRARFARLPLGLGRVESTLAYASAREGRFDDAERWIRASLEAHPANVRAYALLGDIHRHHARYEPASFAYKVATELRPDVREFRVRLVDCLVRAGRPRRAEVEIRVLIEREPREPRLWTAYGVILKGLGRETEARRAVGRAEALDPESAPVRMAQAGLRDGWPYERLVNDLWPGLLGV